MKFLRVILALAATLVSVGAATTNTASIVGWCRSLSMELVEPGIGPGLAISTYDGVPNRLIQQDIGNGRSIVSDELRPRAGALLVYEADYGLFLSTGPPQEVGSLSLMLPTTDADTNGVPDVVQYNQAGHFSTNGTGKQELESGFSSTFLFASQFARNAGADLGSYAISWSNNGAAYAFAGTLRLLHFEGQVVYTRDRTNMLFLQFTARDESGNSLVITGSTAYISVGANEVSLPQFKLRSGSRQYVVQPTKLARTGQRYTGNFKFNDFLLETGWRDYADWAVELTDLTDTNTNGVPDLSDPLAGPDVSAPKIGISVPFANARLTNSAEFVHGTASDDRGVVEVRYSLNGAAFTNARGTIIWVAEVTLQPGLNTFAVQSFDAASNASPVVTRRFTHVVVSPLDLQIVGAGRITPDLDGRFLEVGKRYTVTAVPAVSNLFAFWSGGTSSAPAKLTFTMESNLVLVANFVPNPFLPLQGAYTGLFAEPSNIVHETSGYFSAKLAGSGAFSASLRRGGRTLGFSGKFALDGKATNRIRLSATNQLLVTLWLDLNATNGTQQITGTLDDGARVTLLTANRTLPRSPNHPAAPFAGKYTMALHNASFPNGPGGSGVASVSTDTNGNLRLAGFLADGTALSVAGAVSKNGTFPYYQALYGGKGSIISWLTFGNDPGAELISLANWSKPTRPADRLYRAGFTNTLEMRGSRYSFTALTNALATNSFAVTLMDLLPTPSTTNIVVWNRATRMTNSAGFSLTLVPATGLWTGIYPEPTSRQRLSFRTTLQDVEGGFLGSGFVIQSNLSGVVTFLLVP